ncbi:MAG: hypothetical protein RIC38_07580 [Chromatocurvus sp.]
MSRRQQVRELQTAEIALGESRLALQRSARARLDDLRRLHPAWLLAGGFASGVIAQRGGAWLGRSGLVSSLLLSGLRLARFAAGSLLSGLPRIAP